MSKTLEPKYTHFRKRCSLMNQSVTITKTLYWHRPSHAYIKTVTPKLDCELQGRECPLENIKNKKCLVYIEED